MSKKLHDYYYEHCPPSSSSTPAEPAPSAPVMDEVSTLPPYESFSQTHPNKNSLEGYVRDHTAPIHAFNPSIRNTGDYDPTEPLLQLDDEQNNSDDDNERSGRPPPPDYSLYHAKYETQADGILSRDEHLNQDGEALAQFLYMHNTPPKMSVRFRGSHQETHWRTQRRHDKDGNLVEEQEPITRIVEDFNFVMDCSEHVSPVCQGVFVLPNPRTGEIKSVRELCDDYIHEKNQLKELQLTKVIEWNYDELTQGRIISRHSCEGLLPRG
ncbi:hypothetical protein EC973_002153 [Apophysomyces ossiformis]|uniref:Uncharacterized protein n=1 Tax=Apophysomyces ossiformis TaxID=679940 RepID=A0A8H7EN29_9FUNG|nr:hypothetical protein EC973_002153 [Apophysomyces ossiformis]